MTRKEYMDELAEELSFLSPEARQAALDFYGEMLDDRMEDGMDEKSAVAAMELPQDIAARLRADPSLPLNADPQPMADEAMKFSSLAGKVMKSLERLEEEKIELKLPKRTEIPELFPESSQPRPEEKQKAPEKHEEPAQAQEPPRQEADRQPAQEEYVGNYLRKTLVCPARELEAAVLHCREMPIQITGCPGDQAELVYYTCPEDPYEASFSQGVLSLKYDEKGRSLGRFSFSILGGVFGFVLNKPAPRVELRLPRNALVDLTAKSVNASIQAEDLEALCTVALRTGNSRISLKNVHCKTLECVTSNARIQVTDVEAKKGFKCATSNGRIEAIRAKSGAEMTLTTSNSRIHIEDASAREEMRLTSSNGPISFSRLSAAALSMKTSNSSIQGVLPGAMEDYAIESGTSNGHSNLPGRQAGRLPLSVRTSNGSISVQFEG